MRLEHIPLILGVIVALIGLGFIADASMAATAAPSPDRRRRTRAEPSRAGEGVVGVGTLCMAAALLGRDTWRYGTLAVLIGGALLLIGIVLNRAFLKEALLFRGPARRSENGLPTKGNRSAPRDARPVQGPAAPAPAPPTPASRANVAASPAPPARHPTPLASPVYRPTPKAVEATPPAPPKATDAAPSASPPQPSGPKERRKTPRGKR